MFGRIKWNRPQGLLFSDNIGTFTQNGFYIPNGNEYEDFMILTDHNRGPIALSNNRIENRQRMANGRMRSYHIADKLSLSVSWERLPSRAFSEDPTFNDFGQMNAEGVETYTADAGAGAIDMISWYQAHPGPFYVFLAYDKFRVDSGSLADKIIDWGVNYTRWPMYSQVLKMYFTSFDYAIGQRGKDGFDLMNIDMSLEEV